VIELRQSEWGDWWVVRNGTVLAVHLRNRSDAATQAAALDQARSLCPSGQILVIPFGEDEAPHSETFSVVDDLVADEPDTLRV
jgi:hypothetical protein